MGGVESPAIGQVVPDTSGTTVVGSAKPDAGIFHEALKRAGVVPEQACHIGDEPATDIEGARNVGIAPILIDRKGLHNGDGITKVESFHDLLGI